MLRFVPFRWIPGTIPGIAFQRLTIADTSGQGAPVSVELVRDADAYRQPLPVGGTYQARVESIGSDGQVLAYADAPTFTLSAPEGSGPRDLVAILDA